MKRTECAELVAMLAAAYPAAPMTDATSQVYEGMLADLDFEAAQRAAARLIATSRFLPTIAEIRAAATDLQLGPRRLGGQAWGEVLAEIRRVGAYEAPRFNDALVAECVRLMGWVYLCRSENDVSDRARFIELYDGLAEQTRRDAVAGPGLTLPPAVPNRARLPASHQRESADEARFRTLTGTVGLQIRKAGGR